MYFNSALKKQDFATSDTRENVHPYFINCSIYLRTYFPWFSEKSSLKKYLPELIKRGSKVHEKNMSRERADKKPIRVWLWIVYKIAENNCRFLLFTNFIQTQKRHPTSLDKTSILTGRLLFTSSQNFSCERNSSERTPCEISHFYHYGFNNNAWF